MDIEDSDEGMTFARGTDRFAPLELHERDVDLEGSRDAAIVIDANTIITLNRVAEQLLRASHDDVVGDRLARWLRDVGEDTAVLSRRDGTRVTVTVTTLPLATGRTVVMLRPVTRHEVPCFDQDAIAELVHDLKSPLSALALEVQLMALAGNATDEGRIAHNVVYMERIVHDLLDLCAAEAGRLNLDCTAVLLSDVVERVVQRLPEPMRERVHVAVEGATAVRCDERRLERVVANLLDNALKYSPSQSRVCIDVTGSAQHASISVTDNGPGLSASDIARIFDRYQRGASASGHAGSGLGLFACRKIVEAHQGRIGVESLLGAGARFYVELPLEDVGSPAKNRQPTAA